MRSVKRLAAVVGEWARERRWWAGWLGGVAVISENFLVGDSFEVWEETYIGFWDEILEGGEVAR